MFEFLKRLFKRTPKAEQETVEEHCIQCRPVTMAKPIMRSELTGIIRRSETEEQK